jgi:hypothetical protein
VAAWTVLYSGSNTVGTTELSVTLNSTSGVPAVKTDKVTAALVLDVSAVAAGDLFLVTLYDKARSGDTQQIVSRWYISGAQAEALFMTPPLMLGEGWDFTLKKISGTDRAIASSVRAYS